MGVESSLLSVSSADSASGGGSHIVLGMTRYVIDAPTLLRLVTDGVEVHPDHQLVAPNAVRSQALQMLLDQVRSGEITEKQARDRHTRLTETKIRVLGDRVSRWTSFQIAQEQDWATTTAAEYLAVTKLQADALVTVDTTMAALADGVVALAPFGALARP